MNLTPEFEGAALVALAMFLGGVVGIEREMKGKPAGLRTHMLVCGSAALLVIVGNFLIEHYAQTLKWNLVNSDPTRVIQAIIVGVSFIGAGTILHPDKVERVKNLTTAGSILFTTGIGLSVALEKFALAIVVTFLLLVVNSIVGFIEKKTFEKKQKKA
jgi:putative Mg2+ transporter-C (MgtC) family protein